MRKEGVFCNVDQSLESFGGELCFALLFDRDQILYDVFAVLSYYQVWMSTGYLDMQEDVDDGMIGK